MNSLPTLMQSLLYFSAGLTIASALGVASYWLIWWVRGKAPVIYYYFSPIICFAAACFIFSTSPFSVLPLGFVWAIGTHAERAIHTSEEIGIETFFKLALATVLSVFFCYTPLVSVYRISIFFNPLGLNVIWALGGCVLGASCSPSMVPIFLWVWKSLKLRPGIDRHLKEGEGTGRLQPER